MLIESPHMPEEHRLFFESLPFVVIAARDRKGRPWATLLVGRTGFVRSPNARQLAIQARPLPGDALERALVPGADLGLLGIELETRHRNRVNGRIEYVDLTTLFFKVEEFYGNCPQYIDPRAWRRVSEPNHPFLTRRGSRLTPAMREWIRRADTFFIASGYRSDDGSVCGMDASHRGGDPGLVHVTSDSHLVFPDYAGNNHFNTIGNPIMDPRAGLLFIDFERGSLLQLTGRTKIDWNSEAISHFPAARRLITFMPEEVVELEAALPLRWSPATDRNTPDPS